MTPGAGDDPRSRMGIAKEVLEKFLETATNINFAFAQYSQTLPDINPIFQKHWVYEALDADRFRMVEPGYAYRVGFNVDYAGRGMVDPACLATDAMIGEKVQFTDASLVETRYGPMKRSRVSSPRSSATPPATTRCRSTSATRPPSSSLRAPTHGRTARGSGSLGRRPSSAAHPTARRLQGDLGSRTRTRPEPRPGVAAQGPPRATVRLDARSRSMISGAPIGNDQVAGRHGVTDYNGDGSVDADIDGDNANDWIMYVDLIEERRSRECDTTPSGFPTWTPTPTADRDRHRDSDSDPDRDRDPGELRRPRDQG